MTDLFDIATTEPRCDMFLAYLSGYLDDETISRLEKAYVGWKDIFGA